MNIASHGARLLASWTWRLMIVSAAALLFLAISFVGLRRYDWLVCQCYGHCIPSALLLAAVIGCGRKRLQWPACASAALAPFFTWYLVSDKPSDYFIWSTVLWALATAWFAFEMTAFIRSCAQDAKCEWLEKMAGYTFMSLIYLLIAPMAAIAVANMVVLGMPTNASFWDATIQSLHATPKYLLPIVWNTFMFLKICCAAVLAAHMATRQSFEEAQNAAAEQQQSDNDAPQPPPSDQQESTP